LGTPKAHFIRFREPRYWSPAKKRCYFVPMRTVEDACPYKSTCRVFVKSKGDSKGENVCRILRRQNSNRFAPWCGSFVTFLARARKVVRNPQLSPAYQHIIPMWTTSKKSNRLSTAIFRHLHPEKQYGISIYKLFHSFNSNYFYIY